MKRILSPRRERYLAKFSIFLIIVALTAAIVGCDGPTGYDLTISSTAGGSVTATVDEEETVISPSEEETISDIPEGAAVDLVATPTPDAGYRFVEWTGDVDTIADVNAASTTIIMNGRYSIIRYAITAKFVQGQEIRNWNHLADIRNNLGGSHILMNDLDEHTDGYRDLVGNTTDQKGWQPIGTFTGTFDGRKYEIRDLFIDRPNENGVGLFGYVGQGGKIQNIRVVNATITGKDSVGGLVGENYGTVSDSYSTGSVTGENSTGGLVGWNQRAILDSYATGSVSGGSCIGGLVGYNKGTVSNSHFTGNATGRDEHVGGLVGWNEGAVRNSDSMGSVNGTQQVGGLVGWNGGSVGSSSCSSNVTGNNKYVGGLVGYNRGTVSYADSSSNVTGSDEHVGGLVGWNEGTVESSQSTGNVKGNDNVGGLVGFNYEKSTVKDCHSSGNVTSEEGSYIGGVVGWNEGKIEDSYSSSSVSGPLSVGGLVGGNKFDGTVKKSYSTGNVSGDTYVGGLVGQNDNTVEESKFTGSVSGNSRVGGLVGYNEGAAVSNSYSTGSVAGGSRVGGLVGYNEQSSVENCYSTGKVTGLLQLGGLVGVRNNAAAINSFWDTETSAQDTSDGGTGKNTTEMKSIGTFSAWEITAVPPGQTDPAKPWNIVNGVTYPFLSWEPVS